MNSNNWIILTAYVTTYTWKTYYFNRENRESIEKALENNKFVKIWTATIATSDIKLIDNLLTQEEKTIYNQKRLSYYEQNTI